MKKINKKLLSILMLILILFGVLQPIVNATEIDNALIQAGEDCGLHLQYWHNNQWTYITTTFVYYLHDGVRYPAYCLNVEKDRSWRGRRLHSRY